MVGELETIRDPRLHAAVRDHLLGMPDGADPKCLTALTVEETSALDGLEHFPELRQIGLEGTDVVDLRPLAGLRELQELWLSDTPVTNLRPLSGLRELTVLELGDTPVVDIEPLRPLHHLRKL